MFAHFETVGITCSAGVVPVKFRMAQGKKFFDRGADPSVLPKEGQKRAKRAKGLRSPRANDDEPQTDVEVAVRGRIVGAVGAAHVARLIVPRTAAQQPIFT